MNKVLFLFLLGLSGLVFASGLGAPYQVLVPVHNRRRMTDEAVAEYARVRDFDSTRAVFVIGIHEREKARRDAQMADLAENVRQAKACGMTETTAWIWTFWCSTTDGFTPMSAADGWRSPVMACPLCPEFRKLAGDYMVGFVNCGVDMVLLDDDFCFGTLHGDDLVCTCPRHLAKIGEILGEKVDPAALKEHVLKGGRNRWRDAWMKVNGDALKDFAAFLRAQVDAVKPSVRIGLCSVMSLWDIDGVDAPTIARILAGPKTRPFLRQIGAPYWAVKNLYYGARLQNVIEFERMERSWISGTDIEVVGEGDTFPRPRWTCPASYLELFDLALRADGRMSGILKYGIDYDSPEREPGYRIRHQHHRPLYAEVERAFSGKKAVGVRIYETKNRLADVEIPKAIEGTTKIYELFGSEAAKYCGDLGVPTAWEGEGVVGMAFGPNVLSVPAEARRKGLVIDAWAARLLMKDGVDVGIRVWGDKHVTGIDVVADGLGNDYAAYEAYKVDLAPEAVPLGKGADRRAPPAFVYANAAGEKYMVLPLEAYFNRPGWHRSYEAGAMLCDGIRRLTGSAIPAFVGGNPDVYVMAKDGPDGTRAVGVFNMSADELVDQEVRMDRSYKTVRFINCQGRLDGDRVRLESVPAWSFAGIELGGYK